MVLSLRYSMYDMSPKYTYKKDTLRVSKPCLSGIGTADVIVPRTKRERERERERANVLSKESSNSRYIGVVAHIIHFAILYIDIVVHIAALRQARLAILAIIRY